MMIALLIISTSFEDDYKTWVPDLLRDQLKYELVSCYEVDGHGSASLLRIKDNVTIRISVSTDEGPQYPLSQLSSATEFPRAPRDGYPLGTDCRIVNKPGLLYVEAKDGREYVKLSFRSPKVSSEKYAPYRKDDFTEEQEFCVQLVRTVLSRYAALRAGDIGQVSIDGKMVDTFVAAETGVVFYDLVQYVRAKGSRVKSNNKSKRYEYSLGDNNRVALLGCSQIKKGFSWMPLPDVPMEFNRRVWMPLEALR